MRWFAVVVLLLIAAGLFGHARTLRETTAAGDVEIVSNDDPAMRAAVAEARATLPTFLDASRHPKPGTSGYAVKIGLGPPGAQEFFWISPFTVDGDILTGRLGNRPQTIRGYAEGQTISVPLAQVTDWMYLEDGATKGNYSACALLSHQATAEQAAFKQQYKLDCEGK